MNHPNRIQRTRIVKLPAGAICVTRPGKFGNPFQSAASFGAWLATGDVASDLLKPMTADELEERRQWILVNVHTLRGKLVACWCGLDKPCHGNELARRANNP